MGSRSAKRSKYIFLIGQGHHHWWKSAELRWFLIYYVAEINYGYRNLIHSYTQIYFNLFNLKGHITKVFFAINSHVKFKVAY